LDLVMKRAGRPRTVDSALDPLGHELTLVWTDEQSLRRSGVGFSSQQRAVQSTTGSVVRQDVEQVHAPETVHLSPCTFIVVAISIRLKPQSRRCFELVGEHDRGSIVG